MGSTLSAEVLELIDNRLEYQVSVAQYSTGDLVQEERWRQGHGPGSPYNWCAQHSAPAPST